MSGKFTVNCGERLNFTAKSLSEFRCVCVANKEIESSESSPFYPGRRFGDTIRDIMNGVLFYQLLICAAVTAFNLFALESNGFLSLNAAVSMYLMVSGIITTFLYCYLAENFTAHLLEIGLIYYDLAWYELPVKRQKMFVLLIKRARREIRLKCFGLIDCSLSVFWSVRFFVVVKLKGFLLAFWQVFSIFAIISKRIILFFALNSHFTR